ncbi:thioredoxin [Pyrococcus furiosus DSM 3638]|uniref:Thioredoxin n=3 Tax=Pyrococcus furiosus TaxID=2261 RepID=A0A5C0XNP8_PYRFU|nr:thioredoxin family protein [Pyrococcus furiosus]AAL80865.1 hypothetical protein PF0741 [Pyrococcus furiosus DSM 3638]AFN03532.1 hypothetical protein PFC_02865 [Pyrococcus furiosus COM1]QEK78429.1 thioredoxin [Pyrococcus furiosus DSM 3638]
MIIEYDGEIDFTKGRVVLWFSIPGCPPCRLVERFMTELSEYFEDIQIVHINAGKWKNIVDKFNILNVPTLVYLKDGREVGRQNLIRSKEEILKKLKELQE